MQLPSPDDPRIKEIRRRAFENALAECGYKRSLQNDNEEVYVLDKVVEPPTKRIKRDLFMYDFVEGLLSIEPDELDILFLVNKVKFNAASTFISKFSNLIKKKNKPLKGNESSFKMSMTDFIFDQIIWNRLTINEQCISKHNLKKVEITTFKRLREIILDVNLLYKNNYNRTETLFSFLCPSGIITELFLKMLN